MTSGTPTDTRSTERFNAAAVEIDVDERREALRLMEALIPFHSFLVQYERERWAVYGRVPGCHGESLDDLLIAIEDWAASGVTEFTGFLDVQLAAPAGTRARVAAGSEGS